MTHVEMIDIASDAHKAQILELERNAFGSFGESLYDHILRDSPSGAIGYGIYDKGSLVAFNGFIGHAVQRAGVAGTAYQSCMSATHKDYGGRGYFSAIIKHAQNELKALGGAFIFGFPNHNSGPIFTKKLGFTISDNLPCFFVKTPLGLRGQLDEGRLMEKLSGTQSTTFDIRETAGWKSQNDMRFLEVESLTNYLFGKIIIKKNRFVSFPMLVIGGYEINKPHQFGRLVQMAMKKAGTRIARVNANSQGALAQSCRFRRGGSLTEPTISYALNWDVQARDIEACGGLKDVY